MSDLNTNKVKKDKKRRRRNYDDIDNQIQKIEEDTKIKQVGVNDKSPKALEDVDSDDLNDDELDKLMLLEEEKEKLLNKTETKDDDESEESFELSAVEDVPTTRRTRGKVIDYKKTAEELNKEDEEQDYDSDDDAEYVPEE
ncbi:hypothetical protein ACO0OL_001033 [Hanseniaspora opuntiae]